MAAVTSRVLAKRWMALAQRLAIKKPHALFAQIRKHYSERHRAYHNQEHLRACLEELDRFRRRRTRRRAKDGELSVELALWFHDLIYDSRKNDNEARSAEAFERLLGPRPGKKARREVVRLILATKHNRPPRTSEEKLIVDVDLSILGQICCVFDAYEKAIRKEYAWVPKDKFRDGRIAVLKHFLSRRRVYSTPYFFKRYEKRARANMRRAIRRLEAA